MGEGEDGPKATGRKPRRRRHPRRELFGPRSGNGYADLAAYDADGNGWIDEADPVFTRLRLWCWDGTGEARFLALGEVGIGAIYLAYAPGAFNLRDGQNQVQGRIRRTGIFFREDGTAGTTHCLDLIV
ncbi:MAG: hypothetical protein QHH27_06255 [Clostridia bacterium]|nr:hypothetical protein [Clostridia bacterium]MDH7573137.1 hypothetical protein [Clostridia bacterium]